MHPQATLIDGVGKRRENPNSFFIPSQRDRENVPVGGLAKLGVTFPAFLHRGVPITGERFFVRVVKHRVTEIYEGVVEQSDMIATAAHGIKHGDTITFGPQHIINLEIPHHENN